MSKKLNPYVQMSIIFSYIFWPFNQIKYVKERISPLVKLINDLFIGNHTMTFLAFWYPMIFIGILPNVSSAQFVVFNMGSFIPTVIGVQVMPQIIVTLKNSSLLKRIGATETRSSDITLAFIFYFTMISFISSFMNIGFGIAFYGSSIDMSVVNWGMLFISIVVGTIIGMSFGMLLSGVLTDFNTLLVIGLMITVPGAFLTGQFLPPNLVNTWGPLRYISYLFPQKVSTSLIQIAVNGGSIFAIGNVDNIELNGKSKDILWAMDYSRYNSFASFVRRAWEDGENWFPDKGEEWLTSSELMSEYLFDLSDKAEFILTWSLTPIFIFGSAATAVKTFKWGVR